MEPFTIHYLKNVFKFKISKFEILKRKNKLDFFKNLEFKIKGFMSLLMKMNNKINKIRRNRPN